MPDSRILDDMLFNYETTNRYDFRNVKINPIVKTVYNEKPGCLRIRPPPLKDIHTLSDWKYNNVPSGIFVKPKDIVRTDPKHIQEKYEPLLDLEKDEVQKTRPRLIMTPAASVDNILDAQTRDLLIEDVYKTTTQRAYEVAPITNNLRAPFPGLPAPANPIRLRSYHAPYVSPEWRMQSAGWDGAQLRGHCDPSTFFYLARKPRCDACEVTAAVEAHRKLKREMKKH